MKLVSPPTDNRRNYTFSLSEVTRHNLDTIRENYQFPSVSAVVDALVAAFVEADEAEDNDNK